jgi:DNA polymerase I-like protein with 3'-5' exonuclease and polymerase domains
MTKPHPTLCKVPIHLLKRLPKFLINPDPTVYMGDNFIVFDFETNVKGDGGSPLPCWKDNSVVCGSWIKGTEYDPHGHEVTPTAHNVYGNELEMGELAEAVNNADFIVAHNGKFDIGWLIRCGVDPYKIILYDTMIAEYCLNGNLKQPLNLGALAKKYLGYGKEHFIDICMKGGVDPEDMPQSMLVSRCDDDVRQTRDMFLLQRDVIDRRGLLGCVLTRCLLSPALAHMEAMGMCLDAPAVETLYNERAQSLAEAQQAIDEFTGGINPRSVPQVREFVYEVLKFKPKMKGKGKGATPVYSTKTDDLLKLAATTKKQQKFLELKQAYSGFNADVTKNLLFFHGVVTDKRHALPLFYAQFNQTVTVTHRLSSSGIPRLFPHILDDKGKPVSKSVQFQNFKREFKPIMKARKDGWLMGEADGSQLEFRVAAFMGQCKVATQAIVDNLDVHTDTMNVLAKHGQPETRQDSKQHTFKPLYGGKSGTVAEVAYYEWFKEHYSGVTEQQQKWLDEALRTKKVVLPHGFTFFFPHCKMSGTGYVSDTTSICNYPVQHFATAEIIPVAVVYLWHLMKDMESFLVNTVHDSAIAELHPDELEEFKECSLQAFTHCVYHYIKEVYAVEFNVPLGVGVKIGRNWGKGEEVKCAPMPPFKLKGIDYTNLITEWVEE